MENLVIVESPHKAQKIQEYLGKDFVVKSSKGHVRDLPENSLSIDIEHGFTPEYVIPADKQKLVNELKKDAKSASTVWLASDEDREGEAIAWHLSEVLGLKKEQTKRIVFHEVTKPALLEAIKTPREVDMNLVSAQQARRVLDRLVGFELSPVLWKKIQPRLSAGRVQSVALRLVVDREREIEAFSREPYYKVEASFIPQGQRSAIKATLECRLKDAEQAQDFLNRCIGASYTVCGTSEKEGTRTPAAPFTTSSLQQEAYRKLGMSVQQTMQIAQKLYEEGLITYMRTDSVNLSSLAINTAKKFICENFGEEYSRPRKYKTNDKSAQEAHEAIRPTYIQNTDIEGTSAEKRLYQLIWKRTVACQMADAKIITSTITIASDRVAEKFIAEAEKVSFDGFLKLYREGSDDESQQDSIVEGNLPSIQPGTSLKENGISATCKFTQAPQRYNQASLIQKLKDLGIGRPSTYQSTISTLIKGRGYIVEGDKEGHEITVTNYTLRNGVVSSAGKKEKIGADKRKFLPQDIGIMVSDYLVEHFPDIMDYQFTADVEKDFDEVADGQTQWDKVISSFYEPFHNEIQVTMADRNYSHLEREIGIDPADGQMIVARFGQFGPYVQKGEGENRVCASLAKGQIIESITLEEAVRLLQLPRNLGQYNGTDIVVTKGRYGAYLKYGEQKISLPRTEDPLQITLDKAIGIIQDSGKKQTSEIMAQWGDIQLIKGMYGPYLKCNGNNYRIPRGTEAETLTEEDAKSIIRTCEPTSHKRRFSKK